MKKLIIVVLILVICICVFLFSACDKQKDNYLRIHIRANSNDEYDQEVKLVVRDSVVTYLSEKVENLKSQEEAKKVISSELENIENISNQVLSAYGLNYKAKAYLTSEDFPTRVYEDLTLEEGLYDALIIELGEAKGDNWWCVVFPPLCFVAKDSSECEYKSLIVELFELIKAKCT